MECAVLLEACTRLRTPRRAALAKGILSVLIFAGLRATETLDLELGDVSFDRKTITVRQGKGQKARTVYPSDDTMVALREWIAVRGHKTIKTPYLFANDPNRRMAYNGLLGMRHERKLIAGYADRDHIKPHALRRAFATRLMENGASIRTIQSALGHSDANTTFVYLATSNDAAKPMSELAALKSTPAVEPPASPPAPSPTPAKPNHAAEISRRRRTSAR